MKPTFTKNIILLALIALPLLFVPSVLFGFVALKFTIVWTVAIITAFGVLVNKLNAPNFKLPINTISVSALAIVLITIISAFLSESVSASFFGIGYSIDSVLSIVALFILFISASFIFSNKSDVMRLHTVVIATSVIVALWQLIRFATAVVGKAFPSFGFFDNITVTTIGSFNDTAIFVGLGVVIAMVATRLLPLSKAMKIIVYILSIISIFILMVINFTLLWYVLGISAIAVIGYAMSFGARDSVNRVPIFPLIIALASCAMIIGGPKVSALLVEPLGINYIEVRPDFESTLNIGISTIKHDPVFGVGPSRFVREWHFAKNPATNSSIFWNFDFLNGASFVLTTLTTVGLLGFIAWLVFVITIIISSVKAILRSAEDKLNSYLTVSSGITTIFLWTFSILYVPGIVILSITFIFTGAFVGLMVKSGVIKSREITSNDDRRYNFVYVFVVVSCMMLTVIYAYLCGKKVVASVYYDQAQKMAAASEKPDINAIIAKIDKALFFNIEDTYYRAVAELRLAQLGMLTEEFEKNGQQPSEQIAQQAQQMISNAVAYAQEAIVVDPSNRTNYLMLGRVYRSVPQAEGSLEMANQAYDQAERLAPNDPGVRYEKAIVALVNQDYQRTLELLVEAVRLKPNFVEAIQLYNELDQALKNQSATPNPQEINEVEGVESTETGAVSVPADEIEEESNSTSETDEQ